MTLWDDEILFFALEPGNAAFPIAMYSDDIFKHSKKHWFRREYLNWNDRKFFEKKFFLRKTVVFRKLHRQNQFLSTMMFLRVLLFKKYYSSFVKESVHRDFTSNPQTCQTVFWEYEHVGAIVHFAVKLADFLSKIVYCDE